MSTKLRLRRREVPLPGPLARGSPADNLSTTADSLIQREDCHAPRRTAPIPKCRI
jgi:hypothetical protein